jgi:DNA-binding beta-propeller fold protein YncE
VPSDPCRGDPACRAFAYVTTRDRIEVFDVANGYRRVKAIRTGGKDAKGVCASRGPKGAHLFVTWRRGFKEGDVVQAIDLATDKPTWTRSYGRFEDRLACAPDGQRLYVPLREDQQVVVVDAATGDEVRRLPIDGRPHNALVTPDGLRVYVASLTNPTLHEIDPRSLEVVGRIGPFTTGIRPFTVDPVRGRAYVNVDRLLGFEVGDLTSGRPTARVEVEGYPIPDWKQAYHLTPSHGIALTPDGRELWLVNADGHLHGFDVTATPPRQVANLDVSGDPGWLTISLDGRRLYAASGEVFDLHTRRLLTRLPESEKLIELAWSREQVVAVGDQFAMARPAPSAGPALVVGLDRHHSGGTYAYEDTTGLGFSKFGAWLRARGHAPRTLTAPLSAQSLAGLDVLLVVNPDGKGAPIAPDEPQALAEWVRRGGVAVLLGNRADAYDVEGLNRLAAPFGVSFTREILGTPGDLVAPPAPPPVVAGGPALTLHNFNALEVRPPAAEVFRTVVGSDEKILLATAELGEGAILALSDSWLYNRVFDAPATSRWKSRDNLQMLQNVVAWFGAKRARAEQLHLSRR